MAVRYLSFLGSEGTCLGQSAAELIAFHGKQPIAQATVESAVTTAVAVTSGGAVFGFATTSQANGLVRLVNSLRTIVVNKGIAGA